MHALFLLLAQAASCWAAPKQAIRDARWQRRWLAPRDWPLRLHIALRQEDGGAEVERRLLEISQPGHPSFRKHLGVGEVARLSEPAQGSVHAVESWLGQHGLLKGVALSGGIFEIDATVREAEKLLNTTYFVFSDGTQDAVRTDLFYVPDDVAHHVDFVTPTASFPPFSTSGTARSHSTRHARVRQSEEQVLGGRAACKADDYVTPSCIRQIYNIDYTAKPDRTRFGVYGTEAASFNRGDLQTFLQRFNPEAAAARPSYDVVGTGDPAESGSIASRFETALDTQTALGLAWPAKGTFYNKGGVFGPDKGATYDHFVQFLQELINNRTEPLPSVVSFSESMPEDMMDPTYARRLCNMMAQVGARGVTLLFSSGDNGPNGDQPTGTHNAIFEPEFPASCPFVTAVGGTTNLEHETAATKSTISVTGRLGYTASGGGFSKLFNRPEYQVEAVDSYIYGQVPEEYYSEPSFSSHGRGIPDLSAFSTNFPTVVEGITLPVGGTSAATPLWAAVIALLNDYEAENGRPSLGFVNPWLYNLTKGLKDIDTGMSPPFFGSPDHVRPCLSPVSRWQQRWLLLLPGGLPSRSNTGLQRLRRLGPCDWPR